MNAITFRERPNMAATIVNGLSVDVEDWFQVGAFESVIERDVQIAELQQAIVELANQDDSTAAAAVRPEIEAIAAQVARLEAKTFEQERTIRQTLNMLIEWIEGEMGQTRAA